MRFMFLILCFVFPVQAVALSCLPPDIARTYAEAKQSEKLYLVVRGKLSFNEARLPKTDWKNQQDTPENTAIRARLNGQSLGRSGFNTKFASNVTLNVRCFGPWCGGIASGTRVVAFVEKNDSGYSVEITPCGGLTFAEPSNGQIDQLINLHRGVVQKTSN